MHSISPCGNALKCSVLPCIHLYIPETEEMRRFICEGRKKNVFVFTWRKHAMLLFCSWILLLVFLLLVKTNIRKKKTEGLFCARRYHFLCDSHGSVFLRSSVTYCSIIAGVLLFTEWALNNCCWTAAMACCIRMVIKQLQAYKSKQPKEIKLTWNQSLI